MRKDEVRIIVAELDTDFHTEQEKLEAIRLAADEKSEVQAKYLRKAIRYLFEKEVIKNETLALETDPTA